MKNGEWTFLSASYPELTADRNVHSPLIIRLKIALNKDM